MTFKSTTPTSSRTFLTSFNSSPGEFKMAPTAITETTPPPPASTPQVQTQISLDGKVIASKLSSTSYFCNSTDVLCAQLPGHIAASVSELLSVAFPTMPPKSIRSILQNRATSFKQSQNGFRVASLPSLQTLPRKIVCRLRLTRSSRIMVPCMGW